MSEPKEQLRQQGWHKVGRIADGRWAGQSEAEEPAYQLAVRFVEGRPVETAWIARRKDSTWVDEGEA
jgi:hypothetical protein